MIYLFIHYNNCLLQSQSTATEKMMSESGLATTEIAIIVDSEKSTQVL